ncbi:response regulator [bacterium SCSIO 12741]|nr:response regulator [bacterium SCSIO 12741]
MDNTKAYTILVVDDDPNNIRVINEYLLEQRPAREVLNATSGKLALKLAETVHPDLIVMDWEMPEMSGIEVIKRLKSQDSTRSIPVIMATGVMTSSQDLDTALAAGAVDYIRKPIDKVELAARIRTVLDLAEGINQIRRQKSELEVRNAFIHQLLNASPNPQFYQDKEGVLIDCNHSFSQFIGLPQEEIVGKTLAHIFPENVVSLFVENIAKSRKQSDLVTFEYSLHKEDQETRHLMASLSTYQNNSGEEGGIIGAFTDISERIKKDQLIQEQQALINANLQSELDFKRRELASQISMLLQQATRKEKLVDEIEALKDHLNAEGQRKLKKLINLFQLEEKNENSLVFENKFDQLNLAFFDALRKSCPELTKNETRLCAYFTMNLTPSDIASLTQKSLNSINVAFARLRTKLDLATNRELSNFLKSIEY